MENCDIGSSRSATLPRNHRRHLSSDLNFGTPCTGSRENSPISRYTTSYSTSTLPRKHGYRSKDSSRKASRSSLGKPPLAIEVKTEEKLQDEQSTSDRLGAAPLEQNKTSHKYPASFNYETTNISAMVSPLKILLALITVGQVV